MTAPVPIAAPTFLPETMPTAAPRIEPAMAPTVALFPASVAMAPLVVYPSTRSTAIRLATTFQ